MSDTCRMFKTRNFIVQENGIVRDIKDGVYVGRLSDLPKIEALQAQLDAVGELCSDYWIHGYVKIHRIQALLEKPE